jgi:hypothetical protein
MRHRVRRSWRELEKIGANVQTLPWIREGVSIQFKNNRPPPRFNQGVSLLGASHAQLEFVNRDLARFVQAGSREPSTCSDYVSRLFLVQKPGVNHWRLICDLRPLNKFCVRMQLKMKTLLGVTHLIRKGGYMFSFDLQDGFYALGINPTDRDYFTVNVLEQLYRLAGLPMGWSLPPFHFCKMTLTFVNFLRAPDPEHPIAPQNTCTKTYLGRTRLRGARILPYVDDILLFASTTGRGAHLMPAPCPTARPSQSPPPPNHRFLDTIASRTPHGSRHQHNVMILLHAGGKTHQHRATCQTPHRASYSERSVATRQGASVTR